MFFEVHLPPGSAATQRTLQIEASSWRSALITGIAQQNGAPPPSLENFFIDLGADAITVTDPVRRQVIRITEVDERQVRASQTLRAVTGQFQPIGAGEPPVRAPAGAPGPRRPLGFKDKATGAFRAIISTEIKKAALEAGVEGRVLNDTVAPSPNDSLIQEIPDAKAARRQPQAASAPALSETALEDVFLEIPSLFESNFSMEAAIDFCLDLVTKHIPCGSGGLMFASDNADHLYFAAVRGEGKKKLGKAELSITEGLPAASLRAGVSIASGAMAADPRNTAELATKCGFAIESVCVAPIQSGDRAFGVIVLLNRKERGFFSQYDTNIASYVGSQMGLFIQDQVDAAPLD